MISVYMPTKPVRAEQYQVGMTQVLGRLIHLSGGEASYAPFAFACKIEPGDWLVESGETVRKLTDAEFQATHRLARPGEVKGRMQEVVAS